MLFCRPEEHPNSKPAKGTAAVPFVRGSNPGSPVLGSCVLFACVCFSFCSGSGFKSRLVGFVVFCVRGVIFNFFWCCSLVRGVIFNFFWCCSVVLRCTRTANRPRALRLCSCSGFKSRIADFWTFFLFCVCAFFLGFHFAVRGRACLPVRCAVLSKWWFIYRQAGPHFQPVQSLKMVEGTHVPSGVQIPDGVVTKDEYCAVISSPFEYGEQDQTCC